MKRWVSFCLAIMVAVCSFSFAVSAIDSSLDRFGYGDTDGDGAPAAGDALLVLRYAVHKADLTEMQVIVSDVTGDGKLNAEDALYILRKGVGKIPFFPVEYTIVVPEKESHSTPGASLPDLPEQLPSMPEEEMIPSAPPGDSVQPDEATPMEVLHKYIMTHGTYYPEWYLYEVSFEDAAGNVYTVAYDEEIDSMYVDVYSVSQKGYTYALLQIGADEYSYSVFYDSNVYDFSYCGQLDAASFTADTQLTGGEYAGSSATRAACHRISREAICRLLGGFELFLQTNLPDYTLADFGFTAYQ